MKVIKRNGMEVDLSREKIYQAIVKANDEVRSIDDKFATTDVVINTIATRLYERCRKRPVATSVQEIQDMIETELMKEGAYEVARHYIRYRCEKDVKGNDMPIVVLYTQRGCTKCDILKKQLAAKKIEYDEVSDIETMVAMGLTRTPMLRIDNDLKDYSEAIKWIQER